jgi:hypothetical protein
MTSLSMQFTDVQLAVSEVDAIAAVTLRWFDHEDWNGADPLLIERIALMLGAISRAAILASSKMDNFETSLADAQPAMSVDRWDLADDSPADPPAPSASPAIASVQSTRSGA